MTPLWVVVDETLHVHDDEGRFSYGTQNNAVGCSLPVFLIRRREELVSERAAVRVGRTCNTQPTGYVDKIVAGRAVADEVHHFRVAAIGDLASQDDDILSEFTIAREFGLEGQGQFIRGFH